MRVRTVMTAPGLVANIWQTKGRHYIPKTGTSIPETNAAVLQPLSIPNRARMLRALSVLAEGALYVLARPDHHPPLSLHQRYARSRPQSGAIANTPAGRPSCTGPRQTRSLAVCDFPRGCPRRLQPQTRCYI